MPKIQRKTQKIFCSNAENDQLAVFGSMVTGNPVYTNDIETLQSNEAYTQGWEAATEEDKAPFMEEMNGLQYGLSKQIAYTLQEGIPEYDANTTYYIGSIVKNLNDDNKPVLYTSKIDNNTDNALTNATAWEELKLGGASGFNLFDPKTSDHILEGDELKGWALQGTYVYKEAVAGVRFGYPSFYEKCVDYFNNATTETRKGYISTNGTKVGNLRDKQGVISGFSLNDYLTIPQPTETITSLEMVFKATTANSFAINNTLFGQSTNTNYTTPQCTFGDTTGALWIGLSSNGSNWVNLVTNATYLETNTTYYVKVLWNGTVASAYLSTTPNFTNDTLVGSATISSINWTVPLAIGKDQDQTNYYMGEGSSVDLNECYINVNGSRYWTGTNQYEYKQAENGLMFYDIADKSLIDELYNNTGMAWAYGVDTENERIFLPRNDWFEQMTGNINEVGDYVLAGLPNITGSFTNNGHVNNGNGVDVSGAFTFTDTNAWSNNGNAHDGGQYVFDASRSNPIYGNSDTVQPNAVKKLLYICVGNTQADTSWVNVVEQVTEGVKDIQVAEEEAIARLKATSNALNETQITNCLLEVPQNIKLNLTDGTLTLKAGSVVIVPYGVDDLTSQYPKGATFINDNLRVVDTQFADGKFFVWAEIVKDKNTYQTFISSTAKTFYLNISNFGIETSNSSESGTATTTLIPWTCYYNTSTNIVGKSKSDTTILYDTGILSLPFALGVGGETGFSSITQVFNGMGYIGSTIWVDKGVKGLIPNGKNEDGTLKNTKIETSQVLTRTYNNSANNQFFLTSWGVIGTLDLENCSYNSEQNINVNLSSNTFYNACAVGIFTTTNGVISNFQPKLPFRAVDYNDNNLPQVDGQWVAKEVLLSEAKDIGTYTIDLSEYLPDNNYDYEVFFNLWASTTTDSSGTDCIVNIINTDNFVIGDVKDVHYQTSMYVNGVLPIRKNAQRIDYEIKQVALNYGSLSAKGYRRLGTNQ